MILCDRCLKPMQGSEARRVSVDAASGPGTTIHVHRRPCKAAPRQDRPSGLGR